MSFSKYRFRELILFVGFAVIFAEIALLVTSGRVSVLDKYLIGIVQSVEMPFLTSLAKFLSLVGSSKVAIGFSVFLMVIMFLLLKHRMELILFLWVGIGSHALNTALKHTFQRERPNFHRIIEEAGYSFPSGHSMAAFSLYGIITYVLWRHLRSRLARILLITGAIIMTIGIGWSRIYLGVHYPSDVIGGYTASCAWLMLSIALYGMYREQRKARSFSRQSAT